MPFTADRNIWYPDKTASVAPLNTNYALLAQSVNDELKKVQYPVAVATVAAAKSLPAGQAFYITSANRYGYCVSPGDIRLYPLNLIGNKLVSNGYSGGALVPGAPQIAINSISMNVGDDVLATYSVHVVLRVFGAQDNCAGKIILNLNGQETEFRWHSYERSRDIDVYAEVRNSFFGMTRGAVRLYAVLLGYADLTSMSAVQVLQVNSTLEAML